MERAKEKARVKLTDFMEAWVKRDFEAMYKASNKTFVSESELNEISLEFRHCPIDDFELLKLENIEIGIVATFSVRVKVNGTWSEAFQVSLVCESAPFVPSKQGEWGVNALTVIRGISKIVAK